MNIDKENMEHENMMKNTVRSSLEGVYRTRTESLTRRHTNPGKHLLTGIVT